MTERARAVAALAEALKNWAPDEAQYWHAEAEALVGPVLGLVADAVAEAVRERDAAILRAYHVTLDSLGAPADEWPCNRVKALVDRQAEEIARLRAARDAERELGVIIGQAAVAAERERWDAWAQTCIDASFPAAAEPKTAKQLGYRGALWKLQAALRAAPTP